MIGITHEEHDAHRRCWDLLPWVANERIAATDLARIEPHLRECAACQEELATQRRLREMMRGEAPIVLAPQASFQKLLRRIDAQEDDEPLDAPPANARPSPSPPRARRAPRWLAVAASVQALIIGLLLVGGWFQSQALLTAPRFTTLSTATAAPQGPVIRVVFRDEVTVGELNAIVRSLDAYVVAGPNSAGVYTLQLAGEHRSSEDVEQLAAKLRLDNRVLFSEPAIAESAPR
ncbi:MAG: hypothetical protein GX535_13715 [Xanthomonadaceae bacterium]|nr:hypothetical protein [Xanthomonadaceae bacterium]